MLEEERKKKEKRRDLTMYTLSIREGEGAGGWMSYEICAELRWQIACFATLLPLQKRSPPMIEIGKFFSLSMED